MGCHSLLQGIFPTQGSNSILPHCSQIFYHLSHQGSPVHITLSPKLRGLTQPIFIILHSFWESGNRECVNYEILAQGLSWGYGPDAGMGWNHLKACLGLEDLRPSWFACMAIGRKLRFYTTCICSLGCLSTFRAWQLASPREGKWEEKAWT